MYFRKYHKSKLLKAYGYCCFILKHNEYTNHKIYFRAKVIFLLELKTQLLVAFYSLIWKLYNFSCDYLKKYPKTAIR